jgi:DNA-binding LacI/PurR family transcriptional regulator
MSRCLSPPLTTVRVDTFHLGERAVGLLLRAMRHQGDRDLVEHRHEVLSTTPVIRRSCGAPLDGRMAGFALPRGQETRTTVNSRRIRS